MRRVETLEQAGDDALSWLGDPTYLPLLQTTRAAAVLVPSDCENPGRAALIRVDDPDLALCEVLRILAPPTTPAEPGVHAAAVVSPDACVTGAAIGPHCTVQSGATIGPGTQLHAGVFVGRESTIGRDCVLWPNVVVRERVSIHDRVIIHPNATIGADGFGYLAREGRHVKIPQIGTVRIEDDVEIGAQSAVDRARSGVTRIGRGTKIDNLVQIGHNCDIGEHCIVVAQCGISGSSNLGRYVVLAGQAGVVDHITIGDRVTVAVMSCLTRDTPDGAQLRGVPAIDNRKYSRQQAAVRRLPKMIEQMRALSKRIEQLESAADHPEGS